MSISPSHRPNNKYIINGLVAGNIYVGTRLAENLGLNREYFKDKHLHENRTNVRVWITAGIIFVELPAHIQKLINEGYVSVKINKEDVEEDYDYIYHLSSKVKIGFYKGLASAEH